MSATNTPRPRRVAGHRPSTVAAGSRPRKIADSRRVSVRAEAPTPPSASPTTPAPPSEGKAVTLPVMPKDQGTAAAPRRLGRLSVVLALLASLGAVALGLLAWDLERMDDRADARKAAQVVAAESVETILSYDHAAYDEGVEAAKSLMAGEFEREYAETIETVRPEVLESESVVRAEVVASSVVSAGPDRVEALLFVNQTTTGKQVEQPRVDLNRVVVTLVRGDDGVWLVSDLEAL